MKNILKIITFLFISQSTFCQLNLDVQFREYLGSQNSIHTYDTGDPDDFPEDEIADDFGPRKLGTDDYNWHGGIDFNNSQDASNLENPDTDKHDLILSLQDGQIANNNGMLRTTRYITIDGNGNTGKNFSFLHLFDNSTLPISSGGCLLKMMSIPNTDKWSIVFDNNLGPNNTHQIYAIGQVSGMVNYKGKITLFLHL